MPQGLQHQCSGPVETLPSLPQVGALSTQALQEIITDDVPHLRIFGAKEPGRNFEFAMQRITSS